MNKLENFLVGEDSFWNVIIVFGIVIVLFTGIFILFNVLSAKNYCESVNGDYSLKINAQPHHCNGKIIVKHEGKWNFLENIVIKWSDIHYNP